MVPLLPPAIVPHYHCIRHYQLQPPVPISSRISSTPSYPFLNSVTPDAPQHSPLPQWISHITDQPFSPVAAPPTPDSGTLLYQLTPTSNTASTLPSVPTPPSPNVSNITTPVVSRHPSPHGAKLSMPAISQPGLNSPQHSSANIHQTRWPCTKVTSIKHDRTKDPPEQLPKHN